MYYIRVTYNTLYVLHTCYMYVLYVLVYTPPYQQVLLAYQPHYLLTLPTRGLVLQLRMLLDIYIATESGGSGPAPILGVMCERRVRGRDRKRPFVFEPTACQFDQRIDNS